MLDSIKKICLCSSLYLSILQPMKAQQFDVEGHRGSRGLMPENTIPAFLKALDLGVHTLELDVIVSKDKKVVVSHEPYFNSLFTTKPDGKALTKAEEKSLNLYVMTYAEIKKYDVGQRVNPLFLEQNPMPVVKPLLSDVIKTCEKYIKEKGLKSVSYNIEIKSEEKEYGISQPATVVEFSDLVYAQIKKLAADRIVLQSFDFNVIKHWKKQIDAKVYKKVRLSALTERKGAEKTFEELGFLPDIFSPYFKLLDENKVKFCHEKGVKVVPWTVNEVEDMKRMKAIGTDGLITDYPNRSQFLLEK
jgi:glycerophosphoryl diester phosphodiesterase